VDDDREKDGGPTKKKQMQTALACINTYCCSGSNEYESLIKNETLLSWSALSLHPFVFILGYAREQRQAAWYNEPNE
jgi:hypothetical protein